MAKPLTHAPVAASITRKFTYIGGASDKFWEVSTTGSKVTVRFGRNGTNGQSNTKDCLIPEKAVQHAEKLIREKLAKGYTEVV